MSFRAAEPVFDDALDDISQGNHAVAWRDSEDAAQALGGEPIA